MQLGQLQAKIDEFESLGYQLMAVCPDKPEVLRQSAKRFEKLSFPVLSDASMEVSRSFGISFHLDDKTNQMYKQYGIDLEECSGYDHRQLPVPAIFIVEKDRTISFEYVNPNYRVRPSANLILAAAKDASSRRGS